MSCKSQYKSARQPRPAEHQWLCCGNRPEHKVTRVHITENLTWSLNTSSIAKKAQQRLYFLRRQRKAHLPPPILTMFYRGTVESILSSCIIAWFGNCNASDRKALQRIVRTAGKIIGISLPSVIDIYTTRCTCTTISIVKDPTHPSHGLFHCCHLAEGIERCNDINTDPNLKGMFPSCGIHALKD
ncbi:hypothetical protein NFI96_004837 [Prochilodus magdalenae]|nr:hypothetical protein NFI96_004837 [Prochilodus magdalenae]